MIKMRKLQLSVSLAFFALLTFAASPIYALQTNPNQVGQEVQQDSLAVTATLQTQKPHLDIAIQIPTQLAQGGQAKVELLDQTGQVKNTISYDLQAGWTQMSAWFDMTGYPSGDYSVKVTYNGISQQSSPIHY
ncbi:hypothetical protein MX101_03515 [Streptococcus uberis]|uniref:hypothetical protein n=1 Tax=Streptococcus uberis TaxID=1349 RepID=UPI0027DABE06|nr:hypothetical protein [Streptococcus uberis]MCK1160527.1 hypothetical protein [Streptococcus uberis]MCK1255166.1 hypothetical protein [Streptococcus uberis]